jgi:hypothetical protein
MAKLAFKRRGFDYSGPFTEMVLLGNAAILAGKRLHWDAENL